MSVPSSTVMQVVSDALALLYRSADKEQAIQEVLALAGSHVNSVRACVFESTADTTAFDNTFEWCNEGIESQRNRRQAWSFDQATRIYRDNFDENGVFLCNDFSVLPLKHQNFLATQGVASLVQCAIMNQGEFKGFISFTQREKTLPGNPAADTRIEELTCVGRLLSIALLEHRNHEHLTDKTHELQKAYEEAQRANHAKSDFLARISHDMRTPLNGILGLAKLMDSAESIEAMQKDLGQLEMSARYLLRLVNDTLDVSKIESGRMQLHPTVCEGKLVFAKTLSLLKPNIEAKNITLHIEAGNLPFTLLDIDISRVEQLIMNIVGNAVKYTPEGGTIDFSMENIGREKGYLIDRIKIRDSGIGMTADFLPHIFEPFTQENDRTTPTEDGTGLGMMISKKIVELMGGDISVKSEKGAGTEFTLTLKLKLATKSQREAYYAKQQKQTRPMEDLSGKTILLCEDHPLNAQIAQRLLAKRGATIVWEPNGLAGVNRFANEPRGTFDAVLMDIRMPHMNGLEATRAIRELEELEGSDSPNIPIIAMTANAFDEDVRKSLEAGANAHLTKPFDPDQLVRTLGSLMRNRKRG